jgi:hypothetical protein
MVEATVTGVEATIAIEAAVAAGAVAVGALGVAAPSGAGGAASFELAVADAKDRAKSSPDPDVAPGPEVALKDDAALDADAGAGVETLSWARKAAEDMLAVAPQVKD